MQAFEEHGLNAGQQVLVIGASGGVGHLAVRLASRMGARVTGVCSGANAAFVRGLGAAAVVDYTDRKTPWQSALRDEVQRHGPFDLVLDTVSSADQRDKDAGYPAAVLGADPALVRSGFGPRKEAGVDAHNYVVLGGAPGAWWRALVKRFTGANWFKKGFELFWIKMPGCTPQLRRLQELCDGNGLRPEVRHPVLPLSDEGIREAFLALNPPPDQKRKVRGKMVVAVRREADEAKKEGLETKAEG